MSEAEFLAAADDLAAIDAVSFDVTRWDAAAFRKPLPMKWELSFIERRDGVVVGCSVASGPTTRVAHLHRMVVAPAWRRQGIGGALLSRTESAAKQRGFAAITLELDGDEEDHQSFYAGHGYVLASPAERALYAERKQKALPASRRLMLKLFESGTLADIL